MAVAKGTSSLVAVTSVSLLSFLIPGNISGMSLNASSESLHGLQALHALRDSASKTPLTRCKKYSAQVGCGVFSSLHCKVLLKLPGRCLQMAIRTDLQRSLRIQHRHSQTATSREGTTRGTTETSGTTLGFALSSISLVRSS